MDPKNGGLSGKCAVLIPVSKRSDVFNKVLAPLQNAYLYEESKEAFRYTSAFLFNNSVLQEKYDAFRANRREAGYSEEELKEGYGFLLFDDINKATKLAETGVLTGSSTCSTLGDPTKGVYVSKYSDCLAPDHWYCGKSGFIVIIRLTKGRSNKVQETYTQNCIAPSVGFDCHESKDLPLVSANTSSFLAHERTQYYLYELLPGECSKTTRSPSHVCPFAIVPFSYDDANTKATTSSCQEQSEMDGNVLNNIMWRGQLHISSQIYHVRLKSRSGTLSPVKLPPVVKVDQAVSMVTLRQFAPKAVFETYFSGEVSLDGICCSVYEFVPIDVEDPSLSLLIRELKDKDLGLTVCLNESGFLILLHSSNFATCTGNEALQAMFLFPGSRAIQKGRQRMGELEESQMSSDVLHILPALNYAEIEVQKSSISQSEDMRGQFMQQIKNYAALIHSGLAETSSKDVSPLSQDYDESLTSLCSNPKWTNRVWQLLRSYLSYPFSFQLPVCSVTELLAAGNKRQKEVLDEDEDHVGLSPLERAPGTVCSIGPEELLSESPASDFSSSLQKDGANKDSETNGILNCPLSRNPTAELVVSITSAEGTTTVMDKCLSGSNAVEVTTHCEQLSNTVDKKPSDNPTARKTLPRGRPKGKRKRFKWSSPPADEPPTSPSGNEDEGRQPSQCTLISDPHRTEWKMLAMSQCKGGNLTYKYKKVPRSPRLQENALKENKPRRMENVTSAGLDACSPTRKTDRWDLRPIITGCGRTLLPHGSLNSVLQKNEQESTDRERRFKEIIVQTCEEARQPEKMDQDPVAGRLAVNTTNNVNAGDKCHNTEVEGSPPSETSSSPQHNSRYRDSPTRTQEFGDNSMVNIAEADTSDGVPSSTADISSHLNDMNKSEHLLCKLKRLFSRRKRKNAQIVLGDSVLPVDEQLSTEPSLKKCKSDMDREMLKSNTDCQDSRERNKDVLITFAQALGLMPKVPDKIQKTQNTDILEKQLPLSLEGQFMVKSAQFIQMVPSPIQEKLQVKKRQWGKRLHTPISATTESPKNEVCAESNPFEENQKKLFCSTDQSTNALILLADLALGNTQALAQLDPLPLPMTKLDPRSDADNLLNDGTKPDNTLVLPSMLKQLDPLPLPMTKLDPRSDADNLLNDGTKPDNTSVLPSMLKQPSESAVLPFNCPSPEGLVGSTDVIDLIAKEHAYSSSTTSEVPKTSSPAGMPQHYQNFFGLGLPALCNVPPEGTSEHKASIEHMNKDAIPSRRFRRSRIFVEKDGFLKVTRKWKKNYDFDLDSKFSNHPVEKTVCRGLHGSWNFAVKDNGEEAKLIIHMWIGLFYSHSTPRFIHSGPLDLEDCLSDGMVSPSEHKTATVSIGNSEAQDLEPIQEDRLVLNQGPEVLDLSIKKQDVNDGSDISASRQGTNGKEASEAFIREAGIQDEGSAQCQAKHQALQVYRPRASEFDDDNDGIDDDIVKSTSEKVDTSPQSSTNLEHSAVNSLSEDKTYDSLCEDRANIIIQPPLVVETKASIEPEGSYIETSEMGERNENLQNTELAVEPPIEIDTSCEIMKGIDEDANSLCSSLVGTDEYGCNESECEDHQDDADFCLSLSDNEDFTTEHESPVLYSNLPDNETQSMDVASITLPHGANENRKKDDDCQSASDQGHFTKEEDNSLKPKSVSDCHGTIKGDDPGVSCPSSPVGQLFEDGKKDASTDEMLPMQCANSNASTGAGGSDDDTISEENSNIALDKTLPEEHDDNRSVDEAKIEIFGEQEKSNDSTPLQDGGVGGSQAEVLPDVSVVSCDHQEQDDELIENEVETAYILAPKAASHHQAPSPQDGVSNLLQDPSEMPIVGKDDSKHEVEAGPQVLPLQDSPVEVVHEPKEMAMNIDVYRPSLENCEQVPIAENVLSVLEDSDSKHKLSSEDSEVDQRCPTPTKGDGPGVYCQASLVGQPYEGDGKKDASSDEMLQAKCANASMGGGGGDDTISEDNLNIALDKTLPEEHDNDSMDEANIEIVSDQNKSDNNSTPLQDGVVGESQAEVLPDVSVVSCDYQEQDDELMENEIETAYILAPKAASHHQAQSPQDGVSNLLQDPSEMPIVGKDDSKQEVEAGPQVLPLQDSPVEVVHEPKEMAMNIDVYRPSLENCEQVPIAENVLSVLEDSDSNHKLGSEDREVDQRCPTPTKGDGPGVYCQASLVGQPYEGDGKKDASSDEMLQTQCANTSMGGGDDTISEENLNIALDKTLPEEHDNDSMDEANIEIVSDQNKSDNNSTPLQDGGVGGSQAEVLPDVSVVSCDDQEQDDELMENEVETAYIVAPKAASHHQAQSPQDGVSKLLQDPSEMPIVGKDNSKQGTGTQVLPFQENILEMANELKEMAMDINMSLEKSAKVHIAEILSVLDGNYEHTLGSEESELNERCPTPTLDENPYEYIPSLEQSISHQVCKSSPEKEHGTNSTLAHQWGKEVHAEPELKAVGDQDPGRDLYEENQTPRSRLLEITDLPPYLNQSPTLCRKSIGMDNFIDKTSHVNVGMPPAKQSPVKRKMLSEGCSLPAPYPPKKRSNDQEIYEAPVQSRLGDDSHPCSLCPVVVIKPSRTDSQADDIYKVKEMDNLAISDTSDDNQTLTDTLLDNQLDVFNRTSKDDQHENEQGICSKADRVSGHGVGECVLNKPNSIDALYQLEERGTLKPSRTVPSIVSTQSDEGDHLSSSSFHDPNQDCPVEKKPGQLSSIHSDDHKGVTSEDILKIGPSTSSFKYTNYRFTKTVNLEQLTETCIDSDLTQFSMEQEFLIFSEEMKQLLNGSKRRPGKNPNHGSMHTYPSSDRPQSVLDLSIDIDVPESGMEVTTGEKISYRHEFSSRRNSAEANVALSDIEAECARSYHTLMDNVCAGKSHLTKMDGGLRDHAGSSRQMRSEMLGNLNHGLNLVVRKSSKTKFRFYILMTSDDALFEETKALLEADGHTEVQPSHFFLNEQKSSLLLIILRNADIAENIIKVPHLLDLKKSANVLFAGIDQPGDIGNLTHQDLFKKGGFIMLEETAMEALSFCKMKELLDFLQELSKNGKWKWILHYRDSRRLKENARFSAEEAEKKHLIKCCQETGIVEVLPYHKCDQLCREHPSYLSCLQQLQVHNITARFPVFVTDKTDTTEDSTFGRHGILTMNINSLLTVIESEKCSLTTNI